MNIFLSANLVIILMRKVDEHFLIESWKKVEIKRIITQVKISPKKIDMPT